MNDNLLAIYNGLKVKNPHLPSPDAFAGDMADDAKRGILYNGLRTKNPGLPAFDIFSRDLGYGADGGKPEASLKQPGKRTSGKELPGWMLRDAEPEGRKMDESGEKRGFWDTQVKDVLERTGVENNDFSNMALKEKEKGYWDTYGGDSLERAGAGGLDLAGALLSLADKKYAAKRRVYEGVLARKDDSESGLKELAKECRDKASVLRERSDRYGGKSAVDLLKEGDYAGVVGSILLDSSEALPLALMGGYGIAAGAAKSAVDKYDELDEMPETKDMPEYKKVINAVSTGAFEAITGMFGGKIIKDLGQLYKHAGKEVAEGVLKNGLKKYLYETYKRFGVLVEPVVEAIGDGASQIAENVTDYFTGAKDKPDLMEGVQEAFEYGLGRGVQSVGLKKAIGSIRRQKPGSDDRKPKESLPEVFQEGDVRRFKEGVDRLILSDEWRSKDMAGRNVGKVVSGEDAAVNPINVPDEAGKGSPVTYGDGGEKIIPTARGGQTGVGDRIKPAGRGVFGNVYDQFRGKAREAVHFLSQQKGGVAAGALQHPEIGDIDLVWGNEKSGLMKMLKRYPEVLDNLQDEIDGMSVVMVSDNRIVLESPGRRAVISKKLGNMGTDRWLLSAYKKNRSAVPTGGRK